MAIRVDHRLRETHLGDWQGLTHTEVDAQAPAPGWPGARTPPGPRTAAKAAWTSRRAACRWSPNWPPPSRNGAIPTDRTARWCWLLTGTDRSALGGAAEASVENWPILGGMGNASWVQLSGHSGDEDDEFESIRWRLDVWNASAQVSNDVL